MSLHAVPIVVDTNVIFSALLRRESRFLEILFQPEHSFHICESVLSELFRWKEKIARASVLDDESLARAHHLIISHLVIHRESLISARHWDEAHSLCDGVDPADTPHVALTLAARRRAMDGRQTAAGGHQGKRVRSLLRPLTVMTTGEGAGGRRPPPFQQNDEGGGGNESCSVQRPRAPSGTHPIVSRGRLLLDGGGFPAMPGQPGASNRRQCMT